MTLDIQPVNEPTSFHLTVVFFYTISNLFIATDSYMYLFVMPKRLNHCTNYELNHSPDMIISFSMIFVFVRFFFLQINHTYLARDSSVNVNPIDWLMIDARNSKPKSLLNVNMYRDKFDINRDSFGIREHLNGAEKRKKKTKFR